MCYRKKQRCLNTHLQPCSTSLPSSRPYGAELSGPKQEKDLVPPEKRSWRLPFCSPHTEEGPALIPCQQEVHSPANEETNIPIHLQKLLSTGLQEDRQKAVHQRASDTYDAKRPSKPGPAFRCDSGTWQDTVLGQGASPAWRPSPLVTSSTSLCCGCGAHNRHFLLTYRAC